MTVAEEWFSCELDQYDALRAVLGHLAVIDSRPMPKAPCTRSTGKNVK